MNGIDVSRWQAGIDLQAVPCDFVIIKATQGAGYVSPQFNKQIRQAEALNKLIGVYHYATGAGVTQEAEHFINTVRPYIGKAILCLDWEGESNAAFKDPGYAKAWLQYVKNKTGIIPFIYMSKSVCREYAWDNSYPLWCAQYKNQSPTGYQANPWTDNKGFGAWTEPVIYQYSSKGQLPGYTCNLDLNITHITPDEWRAYAAGGNTVADPQIRPTLKLGDHNEYVRAWQTYLNANGYTCGKADAWFGDKTREAVIKFQADHGLEAGYIGPKTWDIIL